MLMFSWCLFLLFFLFLLLSLVVYVDLLLISCVFQVQVVVVNGCVFGIVISDNVYDFGILSFGIFGNLVSLVNVVSSFGVGFIVLICILGMIVFVVFDYGVNGGSSSQCYLKWVSGNEIFVYQFYQDVVYFQVWGNGVFVWIIVNFFVSIQIYMVYVCLFVVGSLLFVGNYCDIVIVIFLF